jgi:hypothetical protein
MKKNVCGIERLIRAIVGGALVAFYITGAVTGTWGIIATIAGCILLLTALTSYCPINSLLGINHCKEKEKQEKLPLGVNQIYQNPQANDGYVTRKPD